MQTVYEAANVIDAHLVRQALEAEGIPAYVRGEALAGGIGELGVFGLVAVMVPEAAWPAARALVERSRDRTMALLRAQEFERPLQFDNFRD